MAFKVKEKEKHWAAPGNGAYWFSSGSVCQKMGQGPLTNTNNCYCFKSSGPTGSASRMRQRVLVQRPTQKGEAPRPPSSAETNNIKFDLLRGPLTGTEPDWTSSRNRSHCFVCFLFFFFCTKPPHVVSPNTSTLSAHRTHVHILFCSFKMVIKLVTISHAP